jgi:hypothetical protein
MTIANERKHLKLVIWTILDPYCLKLDRADGLGPLCRTTLSYSAGVRPSGARYITCLILRDGKDTHSCTAMLEMNIRAYANYRSNKWWDCICKEFAAVARAAARGPPPSSHP